MSKYVIEFDKEQLLEYDKDTDTYFRTLYKAKGFNALVFDKNGLDKLTPLDKALEEAYQKGFEAGQHEATTLEYQQGLEDAWKCAKKIFGYETDGGLPLDELRNVFGIKGVPFCTADIIRTNTASEALAKLKAHEEQQKADEIKVGDEVMSNNAISDHTGVVLALSPGKNSAKVLENDGSMAWVDVNVLIKTGRHFNFLTPLLNEMKEGAE